LTDDRQTTDDKQTDARRHIANVNVSSRSLKIGDLYPAIFGERTMASGRNKRPCQYSDFVEQEHNDI